MIINVYATNITNTLKIKIGFSYSFRIVALTLHKMNKFRITESNDLARINPKFVESSN